MVGVYNSSPKDGLVCMREGVGNAVFMGLEYCTVSEVRLCMHFIMLKRMLSLSLSLCLSPLPPSLSVSLSLLPSLSSHEKAIRINFLIVPIIIHVSDYY